MHGKHYSERTTAGCCFTAGTLLFWEVTQAWSANTQVELSQFSFKFEGYGFHARSHIINTPSSWPYRDKMKNFSFKYFCKQHRADPNVHVCEFSWSYISDALSSYTNDTSVTDSTSQRTHCVHSNSVVLADSCSILRYVLDARSKHGVLRHMYSGENI
jgi:hypothetical protein